MIFETKRNVVNNVFTVEVTFAGYGTDEMDEKHEQALFNDLGNPVINMGAIVFEGRFKVDGDLRVVPAEGEDGDVVKFIQNVKRYELAPGFAV
jgi:hypothetical protein